MPPENVEKVAQSPAQNGAILALEESVGARWDAIRQARLKTDELLGKLRDALSGIDDPDCAVVVTGSLGRGEACEDSDADWVLLVDGPSDPGHARMARTVGERIQRVFPKKSGRTGTFGGIVISHDLVHYVAGTRDTNENLTRRFLLLAESRPLTNPMLRERVIRNVLTRYVVHDRSVQSDNKIPHFLLNDVVRYWRTMASDFASKMWERDREGWGTRNIKLRFSRKLLFVWGLLASFSGELFDSWRLDIAANEDARLSLLLELIRDQTDVTPLNLLATVAAHPEVEKNTAERIFSAYDKFLHALNDESVRKHLDELPFENAAEDDIYDGLRSASQEFRHGLNDMFFDQHPQLKELIRLYGVF